MSNPQAKSERSKAKDIRQSVVEQKPQLSKRKKKHNYKIVCDLLRLGKIRTQDITYGKYEKLVDAEKAFKCMPTFYVNASIERI